MNKLLTIIISASLGFSVSAHAENKTLNADEAKALFSNKTFDGVNEIKGSSFSVYSAADGTHVLKKSNGSTKEGAWRINDAGEHCVKFKREKCAKVISVGDGVYEKHRDDEHTHTLKNFVDGNQL